jgi:large subunit ribosomal protein L25
MAEILEAKKRITTKRSEVNSLRKAGKVPAILYGYQVENTPIYIDGPELIKTIRSGGRHGVISLNVEGNKQNVILTDFQKDELKGDITHIDFLAVNMASEIEASVRIELLGDSAGVKDGGVLQQPIHELSVSAKPNDIPESVQVDVTSLQVGEALTVGDVRSQYPFTINHEDSETIASVLPPRQEEEISTGEQQEPGIPENVEGRETKPEGETAE